MRPRGGVPVAGTSAGTRGRGGRGGRGGTAERAEVGADGRAGAEPLPLFGRCYEGDIEERKKQRERDTKTDKA